MDHINQNIRYLRKVEGLTQAEFAEQLGIKRSLLGAYEEGRAKPRLEVQLAITRIYALSLDRLVREDLEASGFNTSAASSPQTASRIQSGKTGAPGKSPSKSNATKKTGGASPTRAAAGTLQGPARVLAIAVDSKDQERIVLVGERARAGYLAGYADPEYMGDLPHFDLPFLSAGTYRAFEITGDSMLPVQPGSVIVGQYVSDWSDLRDGQTYILLTSQEGIVYKRVFSQAGGDGQLILQSDNPSYPPYPIDLRDVLEIWEAKLVIARLTRQQDNSVEGMMRMLADVQQRTGTKASTLGSARKTKPGGTIGEA